MQRPALSMYRKIFLPPLILLLILIVLSASSAGGGATGSAGASFAVFCFLLLILWIVLGRMLARALVPLFVSRVVCPGCHEDIDCVGVWNCQCGFHDHKERHLLAKRCPKCGQGSGHLDCPRCGSTILLW